MVDFDFVQDFQLQPFTTGKRPDFKLMKEALYNRQITSLSFQLLVAGIVLLGCLILK